MQQQQQRRRRNTSTDFSSYDMKAIYNAQNVPPRTAQMVKDYMMEMAGKIHETVRSINFGQFTLKFSRSKTISTPGEDLPHRLRLVNVPSPLLHTTRPMVCIFNVIRMQSKPLPSAKPTVVLECCFRNKWSPPLLTPRCVPCVPNSFLRVFSH